jgi:hypothetical protein
MGVFVAEDVSRPARQFRRYLAGSLLAIATGGLVGGCASLPEGPTYTEQELRAMCERRGGWWRGDLIAGYCEYQTASQAP